MKKCAFYRKQMAIVSSDSSARLVGEQMQKHLAECAKCREYWKDIGALCNFYISTAQDGTAHVPAGFHESWLKQVIEDPFRAPEGPSNTLFRVPRLALRFAIALLLLVTVLVLRRPDPYLEPIQFHTQRSGESAVTLLDYRLAASEQLDVLLRRGALSINSPKRTYTVLTRIEGEGDF